MAEVSTKGTNKRFLLEKGVDKCSKHVNIVPQLSLVRT